MHESKVFCLDLLTGKILWERTAYSGIPQTSVHLKNTYNPSPLFYDGRVYVLYDRGLISYFDSKTGKILYDRERLSQGAGFTSSPWATGENIFCLNEDGDCYVLRAGDKFTLRHVNRLGDDDMCMATPHS